LFDGRMDDVFKAKSPEAKVLKFRSMPHVRVRRLSPGGHNKIKCCTIKRAERREEGQQQQQYHPQQKIHM
jgi:hypothetical protein